MKIRFLQLHKPLNLPGPGSSTRWSANGRDGLYAGQVKYIRRDAVGYWMFIPAGLNQGWLHVPFTDVQYAGGEPPAAILEEIKAEEEAAAAAAKAKEEADAAALAATAPDAVMNPIDFAAVQKHSTPKTQRNKKPAGA